MNSGTQSQEKSISGSIVFRTDLGTFTDVSWEPSDALDKKNWAETLAAFDIGRKSLNWYIGDGLLWGERRWGETYQDVMEVIGVAYSTVANWKWVAKKVPPHIRHPNLEWDHHKLVASKSEEEQVYWLDLAEDSGWTSWELKQALMGKRVTLIGNVEAISRTRRKLMTEFFSLAFADKTTVDNWIEELSREEINRITDGEVQEAMTRLSAIIDILHLY